MMGKVSCLGFHTRALKSKQCHNVSRVEDFHLDKEYDITCQSLPLKTVIAALRSNTFQQIKLVLTGMFP